MPHHITHEHVQAWLDEYAHARDTYDAEYRRHPADEPEVGRDTIVHAWLNPGGNASTRDEPGTYKAEMLPYAVDGSRAVVIGSCTYWTDASRTTVARIYYSNWPLEFGDDGKCSSFTEYWMVPRGT